MLVAGPRSDPGRSTTRSSSHDGYFSSLPLGYPTRDPQPTCAPPQLCQPLLLLHRQPMSGKKPESCAFLELLAARLLLALAHDALQFAQHEFGLLVAQERQAAALPADRVRVDARGDQRLLEVRAAGQLLAA